jgi:hypothetical protein
MTARYRLYSAGVADPQHPAAKAGRFVRAVGLGIARELEKRADAPPKAPLEPPPPPPPMPTSDLYGRTVFAIFVASAVALGLVMSHFEKAVPTHDAKQVLRIALTVALGFGAFVQLTNWRQANQRIVQRLLSRIWGPRGPANRREKTFARICREVLVLVGIAWLAGAVFELLVALGWADVNTLA